MQPKKSGRGCDLHQGDGLSGVSALLVDEDQNANDGANKAEAAHQTGHDERGVHRHGHQLAAALPVVVPVFPHGASGGDAKRD